MTYEAIDFFVHERDENLTTLEGQNLLNYREWDPRPPERIDERECWRQRLLSRCIKSQYLFKCILESLASRNLDPELNRRLDLFDDIPEHRRSLCVPLHKQKQNPGFNLNLLNERRL